MILFTTTLKDEFVLKTTRTYPFVDGLAVARDRGWFGSPKWGYVDKTGKGAIGFQWDFADQFSEKLAAVCLGCRPFD